MAKRAAVQERTRVSKKSKPSPLVEGLCGETLSVGHREEVSNAVDLPTSAANPTAMTEQVKTLDAGKVTEASSEPARSRAEILRRAVSDFEESLADAAESLHSRLSKLLKEKAALDSTTVCVADLRASAEIARRKANDNTASLAAQKAERTSILEQRRECQAAQDLQLAIIRDGATVFVNGVFEKANDPKHVDVLMSVFEKIGLNDTLVSSFPSAAANLPAERTGFMHTVIGQAEQDLLAHIASLDAKLAAGEESVADFEAATGGASRSATAAEALLEESLGRHAAQSAEEAQVAVAAMTAEIASLEAQVDAARRSAVDFVSGPAAALRDWSQHFDAASGLGAAMAQELACLGGA